MKILMEYCKSSGIEIVGRALPNVRLEDFGNRRSCEPASCLGPMGVFLVGLLNSSSVLSLKHSECQDSIQRPSESLRVCSVRRAEVRPQAVLFVPVLGILMEGEDPNVRCALEIVVSSEGDRDVTSRTPER